MEHKNIQIEKLIQSSLVTPSFHLKYTFQYIFFRYYSY